MTVNKTSVFSLDFFKQVKQEIKKVTWPTRKETTMTTVAVLVFSVILTIYLLCVDGIIDFIVNKILG